MKRETFLDAEDKLIRGCLNSLHAISGSVEAEFTRLRSRAPAADGELRVRRTRRGRPERFLVQTSRTHLSYALASGFIEKRRIVRDNWVLFAPYVPGPIGRHLTENNLSYVDAAGNCHLETKESGLLIHVEGKRPARDLVGRSGIRLPSYQLIFAILAEPELLDQPVRQIATAAGIGKTAVAEQLKRLVQQGLLARRGSKYVISRKRELFDRWLAAYPDVVRPAWLQGRYRTQDNDPEAMEREIATVWGKGKWAFGGGAAAWRMNHFYRGKELVLHVATPSTEEIRRLRVLRSDDGILTILRTPGTTAYAGSAPHLAHPVLVYSEMITSMDPRMREAAEKLRERFLAGGS